MGQVTFNTETRYEFVYSPGSDIYLSYVTYTKNQNKYHFFTDIGKLKLEPLSTFSFCNKFVIGKDRDPHIPKPKLKEF